MQAVGTFLSAHKDQGHSVDKALRGSKSGPDRDKDCLDQSSPRPDPSPELDLHRTTTYLRKQGLFLLIKPEKKDRSGI